MRTGSCATVPSGSRPAALAALLLVAFATAADAEGIRRVLVLYPVADGQPGILRFDASLRSAIRKSPGDRVEIYNEYLDSARFPDEPHQRRLSDFLRGKYASCKPDAIVAALAPSLDFVRKYRDELFPGVPVVFAAIDRREAAARDLGPDVVGVPMSVDLVPTLDLALRLHPRSRRVFVVAGRSRTDAYWVAEARRAFRAYEGRLEFVYLVGRPMDELLEEVARLPDGSLIAYLHVFQDGRGRIFAPADVVGPLTSAANAPVYSHFDTFVGRGVVGGRVVRFEDEGARAAGIVSRILAGEEPVGLALPASGENPYVFDWRQLRRWGIDEGRLPGGSVVLHRPPSFWALYRGRIIGVVVVCLVEALLILGLLLQRASRRRAEGVAREGQRALRAITGRLLVAQETERRRIARELHDDLNQGLALLAVELDLLARDAPGPGPLPDGRLHELSGRVKQLSSTVHDLSHQLHPSKLEQLGLVAAVRGFCAELGHAHGLRIDFAAEQVPPSIPADTALCLYRIAQESLRNVIKHSGARRAVVTLRGSPGAVQLSVVDDGSGFDPNSDDGRRGLGLVSMRERLRLVGGSIAIDARPSRGVRIDVRVPLGQARDARRGEASHRDRAGVSSGE